MSQSVESQGIHEKSAQPNNGEQRYIPINLLIIVFLIILASALLIFTNIIREKQDQEAMRMDALMDAKVHLLEFHHWLEEYLAGDTNSDIDVVFVNLKKGVDEINLIVHGGVSSRGESLLPNDDPVLTEKQEVLLSTVNEFADIAKQRVANPMESGIGSLQDKRFEVIFNKVMNTTEEIKSYLEEHEARHGTQSRRLFIGIFLAWLFLSILAFITIYFINRRRVLMEAERLRAEEAVRQSKEHLQLATYSARIALWDWSIKEDHVIWSENAEEVLGFEPGSFGNTYNSYMKHVYPEDIEPISKRVSQVLEEKESVYRSEYRVILPSGEIRWISAPGQIFYDSLGEPLRIAGIMIDITKRKDIELELTKTHDELDLRVQERTKELSGVNETLTEEIRSRKRGEEALKESEERYRSLIEATTSIIWSTDASGGFVVPQSSWERFTGQPWNEHKGFGWT